MFRHVLVHVGEHPSLAAGQVWPGLLSPRESAKLAELALLPRRRKWLLGRVAAKRLVRSMVDGPAPADVDISVLNRASGEPYVYIEGRGEWEFAISLSHRSEIGMATVPKQRELRIGADLETIEPRALALVRQFFTDGEAALVAASGQARDEVVARIWSAKEAVLKLLGLGLRLDTRAIEVSLAGPSFVGCPAGWEPIEAKVLAASTAVYVPSPMHVVWRREGGYVLTVALGG
jgi:phosphopantetheinyl transferase